MTSEDRIYDHMQAVHGGIFEPALPPSPIPAPAPTLPQVQAGGLPQGNAVQLYGQPARAPFRPVYDDIIDSDDEEDHQNPFHGVDYREQQELLRQAELNRNRAQAARQNAARYALGWQAGMVTVTPRPRTIFDHMHQTHGGIYEPGPLPQPALALEPPPNPDPAPPVVGLPNRRNHVVLPARLLQTLHQPAYNGFGRDWRAELDQENNINPFGANHREQHELARQAALNRERAHVELREERTAAQALGRQAWGGVLAATPVPQPGIPHAVARPVTQPATNRGIRPVSMHAEASQPVVQPVVRPVLQPVVEPVAQPVATPVPRAGIVRPISVVHPVSQAAAPQHSQSHTTRHRDRGRGQQRHSVAYHQVTQATAPPRPHSFFGESRKKAESGAPASPHRPFFGEKRTEPRGCIIM